MTVRRLRFAAWLTCPAALLTVTACQDAEPPLHEAIVRADLAAIIDLQGSTCGKVVSYTLDRRLDYRVVCATGEVYRVHVSAEGYVNVKEHPEE